MPGRPNAAAISAVGKGLLVANALWFLEEDALGKTHPETSFEAGILHKALPASKWPGWRGAHMLKRGRGADCLEVAARDGGHELAKYVSRGFLLDHMLEAFDLELVPGRDPDGGRGMYWHCRLLSPLGRKDPSERLKRC